MSLRKEFQIALENNFGYIENSGITWATLTNWLCSVKRTNAFKMVEAYLKSNRQQQQQAPKPLCTYCGKHGHWEANCLTKRKQGQTKTPEKTQQSGDTEKLTGKPEESGSEKKGKKTFPPCSYCGKSGHSKKNCFKKKKDKREAEVNLVETTAGPPEDASAAESGNVEAKEAAEDMAFMEECEALYSNDAVEDLEKAPIELNGERECWAITDNGSNVTLMAKELYDSFDLPEKNFDVKVFGFEGSWVVVSRYKKIPTRTCNKSAVLQCYRMDFKDPERIILSRAHLKKLGMKMSGIPATFPSKQVNAVEEKLEQEKVFNNEEENFEPVAIAHGEVQHTEEMVRHLKRELEEELQENKMLGERSFCTIPGSEFTVRVKKGQGPVYKRQYPIQVSLISKVEERIREWEANGWIEEVKGTRNAWNNPLVAVPKVSGGKTDPKDIRLCVDARPGNSAVMGPEYNLLKFSTMFQRMKGAKFFTKFDIVNAFHHLRVSELAGLVYGFTTPDGRQMRWIRMPFGPTAACPHFQRVIDIILIGVEDRASGYVDNILVFSITFEQHIDDCREVLRRLTAAGMRIKPAKTKYAFKKIRFLGSIIDGTSRYVDQEKIDKFITLRAPETQRQLQAFLGFINYLRDFIPAYSCVVGPIEALQGVKSVKKAWGVKQVETIKLIKKILSNAPVLEHPNWDRPFTVATDASQFGVGAVLYQKDEDDKMHIIHLHAQSFTKGQKNYPATKRELLAMIAPLKRWRHILMGRKFVIEVDHKALEYIHSSTQYMVLEWLDFLLNFDFTVTYKKGIDHVLPDYLSRLYEKPLEEGNNEVKEGEILFSAANLEADELVPEKTRQFMENFLKNRVNKKLVTNPEERATLITNCH